MLDVAVIGAGPSGLSVAAALLQCKSKPCVKVSHNPAKLNRGHYVKALPY